MKDLYLVAGLSKQALWNYKRDQVKESSIIQKVLHEIQQVRKNHKRMGCRRIYYKVKDKIPIGRDQFELIGFANGFKLKRKINVAKTTWGQRVEVYPNLIEGIILDNVNQVWQSDIFYFTVQNVDYYFVSIEDVYSRKLLALNASKSLRAEQNVCAFNKALKARKGSNLTGCIFHSDRGSQYISKTQKHLLKKEGMIPSMCKMPQQNAYVERIQGTLKYEYLFEHELTQINLQKFIRKIISWYNDERPHSRLNMMTPNQFEKHIENQTEDQRPKLQIFKELPKL